MSLPFYNAIKGTTSGTPGTGAFTPNAASTGFIAWSTVPAGWVGLTRYEDGSDWELSFSYWNGTTLSRGTNQRYASSSGSVLTLTSAATAALVVDADKVQHTPSRRLTLAAALVGTGTMSNFASGGFNPLGSTGAATMATTNFLTEQNRVQYTSATTADAQAGIYLDLAMAVFSTAAGRGGVTFSTRFGASQLPTAPRFFIGLSDVSFHASTAQPSAFANNFAILGKDSTDTNLQFMTNDAGVTAGKTDTGLALTANGWYEFTIIVPPGGAKVGFLLVRRDTGDIFYAERTTDLPANGSLLRWIVSGGLNGTNTGTAMILHIGGVTVLGAG